MVGHILLSSETRKGNLKGKQKLSKAERACGYSTTCTDFYSFIDIISRGEGQFQLSNVWYLRAIDK